MARKVPPSGSRYPSEARSRTAGRYFRRSSPAYMLFGANLRLRHPSASRRWTIDACLVAAVGSRSRWPRRCLRGSSSQGFAPCSCGPTRIARGTAQARRRIFLRRKEGCQRLARYGSRICPPTFATRVERVFCLRTERTRGGGVRPAGDSELIARGGVARRGRGSLAHRRGLHERPLLREFGWAVPLVSR